MSEPNVFGNRPRPTQKAYRAAVAQVIRCQKLLQGLTNVDFADRIGCSDETVSNAENERTDLSPVLLLNIEHEFGPGTIDLVLEIAGSHAAPADTAAGGDVLPPLSACVHGVAKARSSASPGGPQETREELFAMEADLVEARRGINRMLARIKRMREG
jgi:hypothetical protein